MKICHIQLYSVLSGVQRVSLEEFLANTELKKGYQYHLICKEEGEFSKQAQDLGVKVHFIRHLERNFSPFKDFLSFWNIYFYLKRNQVDIVHTHSSKTGLLGRLASIFAKTHKVIHTVHGFGFPATKSKFLRSMLFLFEKFLGIYHTDRLIVMNLEDKSFAEERLRIPSEKIELIYNARRFMKISLEHKIINLKTKIRLLFLGRLSEQKDPLMAIETFNYLKQKSYDVELTIIGDGELMAEIIRHIQEEEINENIKILGWCSNILPYLDDSHILLGTSKWEGFPLAVLEACTRGCIPFMRDSAGYREIYHTFKIGSINKDHDYFSNIEDLITQILDKKKYLELLNTQEKNLSQLPNRKQRFNNLISIYE
jgi:glycosyltransferase involved in cell wall biosynthesis